MLTIAIGVVFLLNGLQFVVDPAAAAAGLGMEVLTGVGASTQLGDIGAFFVAIAVMIALAQRPGAAHWLHPAAILFVGAAVMRTLVAVMGHAAFAPQYVLPEIVMAAILFQSARLRRDERAHEPPHPASP